MQKSIWKATAPETSYPSLERNHSVDVAIVGGGITGITSAYLLARSGKKVAVLEKDRVAGGTTGDSTGNLYAMVDKRLHHIQSKWNKETAGVVAGSRMAAVNMVENLVEKHQINCAFRRVPWILFSENEEDETIEKELKAAVDYGLETQILHDLPLPVPVKKALRVENQAQFNPAAFVRGLSQVIDSSKCSIYENSEVTGIDRRDDRLILKTRKAEVTADKVIMATHTPKGIFGHHTAVYPYREYGVAARVSKQLPEGIFWDTDSQSHHSMRSYHTEEGSFLIVVGGHHKVGEEENSLKYYRRLEDDAKRRFGLSSIDYRWSAQHYKPADGLPFIGESGSNNIFIATGFSTDGLTYGVLSAMILDDLINDRHNPWAETYKALRFTPLKSAGEFFKENAHVPGHLAKNIPGIGSHKKLADVRPGEGKIVEEGSHKLAVHRDQAGQLHCVSASCTHMGCVVEWNNAEYSWDCPCHGSRFTIHGEVIEGPAYHPLEKKDLPVD